MSLPSFWRGALVALGVVTLTVACTRKAEEDREPVVTVDVAPVLNATIQRVVRADALIFPIQQAAIVPKLSAPIKKVYVEKGQTVRAGQLLIELENADLAGAAQENQAAYEMAQAEFETAARATVPQETQKAELDLKAAKDSLDAQQTLYDNRAALFREGAIAQREVKDAEVALTQARNQYELARTHLEALQGFARDQALKAANAQRDQAKGRRDAAQAQFNYSRIVSPINGVVTDRPVYAGEMPASGGPIITVMDLSQVIARAHIAPAEAAELSVGAAANIIASNGAPIAGKVTQISPALDPAGTTVEVWVQAPNTDNLLRPGTSLHVEMIAKTVDGTLVIPQSAVLTSQSGTTSVIVIDGENKPHKKTVMLGIRDQGQVQVTDGLDSSQRVATTGAFELAKLEPEVLAKTKVQIQPPKEEEDDEP